MKLDQDLITQPWEWSVRTMFDARQMACWVDMVVGEFPTYRNALYYSTSWSESRPDDLRLTREREVSSAGEKT